MKRDGLAIVATLLACGILLAAGAAWLRSVSRGADDPAARLPEEGLVIGFRGGDLALAFADLSRIPVYRAVVGAGMSGKLRRELRWGPSVPSPWDAVAATGPSALGLYRGGWVAVGPARGAAPSSLPALQEDSWRLLASSASLLSRREGRRRARLPRLSEGEIEVELRLAFGPAAGGARPAWEPYLPRRASGRLRLEKGRLTERWEMACGDVCVLDLLDAAGASGAEARGWAAVPDTATAVAWFLLEPRKLPETGTPGGGRAATPALARLEQLERFLGFPLRSELAAALAGPGVAALVETPNDSELRPLVALDLGDPGRARRALDRVAALGLLSGAIQERSYRGVSISSWGSLGRRAAIEPAAAVDGGLLLVALRRSDIADAIDRIRAAAPASGSAGLRREIAALPAGAWKAASRSTALTAEWERMLGAAGPQAAVGLTRAVLRKDRDRWVLEGGGGAAAVAAEPLLPTFHRIYRWGLAKESR